MSYRKSIAELERQVQALTSRLERLQVKEQQLAKSISLSISNAMGPRELAILVDRGRKELAKR